MPTAPAATYEERPRGSAWFVAPPAEPQFLEQQLNAFGLHAITGLSSFYHYFNGLREDLPDHAGFAKMPHEWEHLDSLGWEDYIENCEGYDGWEKAIIFW